MGIINPINKANNKISYHLAFPNDGTNLLATLFHNHGPTTKFNKIINNKPNTIEVKLILPFSATSIYIIITFYSIFNNI